MSAENFLDDIYIKDQSGRMLVMRGDKVLSASQASAAPLIDLEKLTEEILDDVRISFRDKETRERAFKIILSRLKNVRDDLETEQSLAKERRAGGPELSPADIKALTRAIARKLSTHPYGHLAGGEEQALSTIPKKQPIAIDWQKEAEAIVNSLNFDLAKELRSRLQQAVFTFIKGIRKKLDFQDVLTKSVDKGGVGLNNIQVEKLLSGIEQWQKRPLPRTSPPASKTSPPTGKKMIASPPGKKSSSFLGGEAEAKKAITTPLKKESTREVLKPKNGLRKKPSKKPSPAIIGLLPPPPAKRKERFADRQEADLDYTSSKSDSVSPVGGREAVPRRKTFSIAERFQKKEKKIKEEPSLAAISSRPQQINKIPKDKSTGRPKIEDVKFVPKLVGPLEEIRLLSIGDFRKLSDNPSEAARKIKEKINLLEEESFSKKVAALKAWRESPLYNIYLQLGNLSLQQSKSVRDLIRELNIKNKKSLTLEEFNAIMKLNKLLRS